MQKVRLIRARHGQEVGDVFEVPDGAAVSELYYEVAGEDKAADKKSPDSGSPQVTGGKPEDTPATPKAGA